MNKECIIIGGSGFLGLNVARGLLSCGYKVTIVDKKAPSPDHFSDLRKKTVFVKMNYHKQDLLRTVIKDKYALFHFASLSLPGTSMENMENDIKDDVMESVKLFKLAYKAGVKKIFFPSSGGTVYGNSNKLPIKEESLTDPISPYGVNRLTIEKYLFLLNKTCGLDYLIYRLGNPYGPGQNPDGEQGLIAIVIYKLLSDLPIMIFGDGNNLRDYIFIEDVVTAFISGIEHDLKNNVYNVGTGKGYTINEVIKIASEIVGIKPRVEYLNRRHIDVKENILDAGKLRSATGWKAAVSLEEGIDRTYKWVKKSVS